MVLHKLQKITMKAINVLTLSGIKSSLYNGILKGFDDDFLSQRFHDGLKKIYFVIFPRIIFRNSY